LTDDERLTMTSPLRTVVVGKAATGTVAHEVRIGPHRLLTDVGSASGGDDLGPDPHEFLDQRWQAARRSP